MAEKRDNNVHYKCLHCPCIFFTKEDLQKHLSCYGDDKQNHEYTYRKVHGRIEHGYGEE